MFKKVVILFSLVFVMSTMSFAQSADEVKNHCLDRFPSKTIGQTLTQYQWFSASTWQNVIMEDGKTAIICWNKVDLGSIKRIQKTNVNSLAIGFRFVFTSPTRFYMDKVFVLYCMNSGFKDMFGVEEHIDQMFDEVYAGSSKFVLNVVNAIDKNIK